MCSLKMIAIIDYGMGNIHSVQKALESLGATTAVTNKPEAIQACSKLVLPGVGAFRDAMLELEKQNLISVIKEEVGKKKIFLGICLGMQLLFPESQEAKACPRLGILKGKVKQLDYKQGIKVPHIGWNRLKEVSPGCPLFKNIADNSFVYFCHSYYPVPDDKNIIGATVHYGMDFAAVVWQENVLGIQFHPEKSQKVGLEMLKNFVEM